MVTLDEKRDELVVETGSAGDTFSLGRDLGAVLRSGDVLGLGGDLGAGKTQLVRGLAAGLEVDPDLIYSPTFTLVAEHEGRLPLHHVDLFRLGERVARIDEDALGLVDLLDPEGVTAIEWYEKLTAPPDQWTITVDIEVTGEDTRRIRLSAPAARGRDALDALRRVLGA